MIVTHKVNDPHYTFSIYSFLLCRKFSITRLSLVPGPEPATGSELVLVSPSMVLTITSLFSSIVSQTSNTCNTSSPASITVGDCILKSSLGKFYFHPAQPNIISIFSYCSPSSDPSHCVYVCDLPQSLLICSPARAFSVFMKKSLPSCLRRYCMGQSTHLPYNVRGFMEKGGEWGRVKSEREEEELGMIRQSHGMTAAGMIEGVSRKKRSGAYWINRRVNKIRQYCHPSKDVSLPPSFSLSLSFLASLLSRSPSRHPLSFSAHLLPQHHSLSIASDPVSNVVWLRCRWHGCMCVNVCVCVCGGKVGHNLSTHITDQQ